MLTSPSACHPDTADHSALQAATFGDIDEQAAALTGWNQRYVQLSAGRFRGSVRRRRLQGVSLFFEDLQQSVHQTGHVDADRIGLGVPLLLQGPARFCGAASDGAQLHVFSGAGGFEFRSPQRHGMLGIEIDAALFAARVAAPAGFDGVAPVRRAGLLGGLPAPALAGLRELLQLLLAGESPGPQPRPPLPLLRDMLLDRLSAALAEAEAASVFARARGAGAAGASPRAARARRGVVVERARDLVRDRLDAPPTVAELCAALGVSRRTLQTSFQESWGLGPLAWLRLLRLDAVRRGLKAGAGSVTAAATEAGFWHFGRFARDYKSQFGELPSQTFARHRPSHH
jgi:AraC family ethanolamine operon transcriptional activator